MTRHTVSHAHAVGHRTDAFGAGGLGALARATLLLPIRAYRRFVSPLKPAPTCRFHPTCSAYAIGAVEEHGVLRGGLLAIRRISKCHPWHPGGMDPVPARDVPMRDVPAHGAPRASAGRHESPEEP